MIKEDVTTELGSCAPVVTTTMTCAPAAVTIAPLGVLVDCNLAAVGVQTVCHVSNMLATRDVSEYGAQQLKPCTDIRSFQLHPDSSRRFATVCATNTN